MAGRSLTVWSVWAVVLGVALLGGCGADGDGPGRPDTRTVSWRIEVGTQADAGFGARVMVNGEQVYVEASATRLSHSVGVVRPYAAGEQLIEVEIISSSMSPAVYTASCTAQVNPNGKIVHADGIPWTLGIGGRLFLRISL
jgi:hypothetical protein